MCNADDFWNREDRADFCGPRISPQMRIRRLVTEQNRRDECCRRIEMWGWAAQWRDACEAAGSCPRPDDATVRARAVVDQFIDDQRASGQCTMRREDERWLTR
ncbi:hypothetical protein [Acidiferrobacter sp.]|jgi:hypothetical protein|uniref:hypothetical protein n=1 Tax=Acidiferrobacter sp. TaxID=1872107 RepID=UPI002632687F|nr:hypothetical protein [Acidiferrobacter sp.]